MIYKDLIMTCVNILLNTKSDFRRLISRKTEKALLASRGFYMYDIMRLQHTLVCLGFKEHLRELIRPKIKNRFFLPLTF